MTLILVTLLCTVCWIKKTVHLGKFGLNWRWFKMTITLENGWPSGVAALTWKREALDGLRSKRGCNQNWRSELRGIRERGKSENDQDFIMLYSIIFLFYYLIRLDLNLMMSYLISDFNQIVKGYKMRHPMDFFLELVNIFQVDFISFLKVFFFLYCFSHT